MVFTDFRIFFSTLFCCVFPKKPQIGLTLLFTIVIITTKKNVGKIQNKWRKKKYYVIDILRFIPLEINIERLCHELLENLIKLHVIQSTLRDGER